MASTSPSSSGYTFLLRPKWIGFHLLCLGAVVGMIVAGFWQLDRLDERRTDNAEFVERIERDPVALDDIRDRVLADPDSVVNRRVTVSGTYSVEQAVLFNRSQAGRAVDNVLTALVLDDGSTLIVNRGAIGVAVDPPPPAPGVVEIVGRLRPSESRERGALTDVEQDGITEVRRVDLDRLSRLGADGSVLPMYVELLASDPAVGPDDPELLDPPALSEGNHLSYAVQWFIFAASVAVGWVIAVRRSIRTRAVRAASTIDELETSLDDEQRSDSLESTTT